MDKIIVAVGSVRRPKLQAVTEAIPSFTAALASDAQFDIVGVEVESGVGHTPSSRLELMRGARQRAEALVRLAREQHQAWRYLVGLEGGLDVVNEGCTPAPLPAAGLGRRVFLESWAYVTDGVRGHFGRSGGVEVPPALAHEVLDNGVELSAAIDAFASALDPQRFAGANGIRNAQGAWGVLSADLITRQEAFRVAVIAAFAPFFNAKMWNGPVSRDAVAR
jgi:inosine/xanthosine triphosphatase